VTAKTESALAVLQDKLPEAVRPLSVSLLSNERDGMKQFEHSIQTIASKVAGINPTRMKADIAAAEEKLNQLHAKIAHVDETIAARAAKHMRNYSFRGRDVTPEEMAKLVLQYVDTHQWFDDEPPPMHDGAEPFDDAAVSTLRRARMAVGQDLCYLACRLPDPDGFPAWLDLLNLHRDLVKAKAIDAGVIRGNILPLVDSRAEAFENAQRLVRFLDGRAALEEKVSTERQPWLHELGGRLAKIRPSDPRLQALMEAVHEIRRLEQQRRDLVAKGVEVPVDAELNSDFRDAVVRLISGKGAFTLPFGKGDARRLIAGVTVTGAAPARPDDWELVQTVVVWRGDARKVVARWDLLSSEFELEQPEEALAAGFKQVVAWADAVDDSYRLTFDYEAKLHSRLEPAFGKSIADRVRDGDKQLMHKLHASLVSHVDKGRLAYALERQQELIRKLEGCQGGIVDKFRSFLAASLGQVEADESALEKTWSTLLAELRRLIALRPYFDEISRVTAEIDKAGATKWAKRLRAEPASADLDLVTPTNWLDAWNWRQAVMLLDNLDGHKQLRELFGERRTLTAALARTYQDLVAEKTWLGVFNNSPDSVRRALQAYLVAIRSIGRGTGVRAVMYRRDARKAMERAYPAVPCWILPHWRVSESIPADVGVFDLVVIDEASQSDITCLPAVLRGTKILVVGDDKQVSPSAVGLATTVIQDLRDRFLRLFPEGALMTPERSFYDLAQAVFAGNSVMLKEHFRCVPAIIEFSNREFYHGDIRPLRVPKANERLDPPLVDVLVKGGFRKGNVNPAEAKAVVDEIKSILQDQRLDGRSIGVVTLLGAEQAAHIQDLVSRQISPVDVVARKIAIGPPPVFQGGERDIMLVSMVVGPGDRSAASRPDMFQRFNVALSRARDRMYLFRSVTDAEFNDGSLNGKVISHFKQPFRQNATAVQSLRERCESGFELEMFDELVRRGFRVEPQVPCGGYRIDFVVEGNEGRRLAIECDGDRYHGPGQWKDDMARQRVLERAGWTFWRCFASTFVRDREAVLDDLMQTLSKLGIEPLGAESLDTTMWVSHKEADPYGVDAAEGEQNVGEEEEELA
jgi:very-short-patch-repair endonuclease